MTPWTVARQALLSTAFSREEHWSGLRLPSPGGLLDPGLEPASPASQADSRSPGRRGRRLSHCTNFPCGHNPAELSALTAQAAYLRSEGRSRRRRSHVSCPPGGSGRIGASSRATDTAVAGLAGRGRHGELHGASGRALFIAGCTPGRRRPLEASRHCRPAALSAAWRPASAVPAESCPPALAPQAGSGSRVDAVSQRRALPGALPQAVAQGLVSRAGKAPSVLPPPPTAGRGATRGADFTLRQRRQTSCFLLWQLILITLSS